MERLQGESIKGFYQWPNKWNDEAFISPPLHHVTALWPCQHWNVPGSWNVVFLKILTWSQINDFIKVFWLDVLYCNSTEIDCISLLNFCYWLQILVEGLHSAEWNSRLASHPDNVWLWGLRDRHAITVRCVGGGGGGGAGARVSKWGKYQCQAAVQSSPVYSWSPADPSDLFGPGRLRRGMTFTEFKSVAAK